MYYGYIDHPVKTRDDWRKYKEHFLASTEGRYPPDLDDQVPPEVPFSHFKYCIEKLKSIRI